MGPKDFQRRYNTEVVERRYDTPQDVPFLDGFPDRLIREGLPGRLKRESIRRKRPTLEDIFDSRKSPRILGDNPSKGSTEGNYNHSEEREPNTEQLAKETSDSDFPLSALLPWKPLGGIQPSAIPLPSEETAKPGDPQPLTRTLPVVVEEPSDEPTAIHVDNTKCLAQEEDFGPDIESSLAKEPRSQVIHVLGSNEAGKFIAHSLAALPHGPPVTLLVYPREKLKEWYDEGASITVLKDRKLSTQSGISAELSINTSRENLHNSLRRRNRNQDLVYKASDSVISNLIVTIEAHKAIVALDAIKHRLRPSSTICFVHGGMGIVDEVNLALFPDPLRRPNYALAEMSHKLVPTELAFTVIERAAGSIHFTTLPREATGPKQMMTYRPDGSYGRLIRRMDDTWDPYKHLMRTLTRSPELMVHSLPRQNFYKLQIENIALRSVVGPLTVAFDCYNDELLYNYNISRTMKLLVKETCRIIRACPEVSRMYRIDEYFSPERLERIIISKIRKSGRNMSSMLRAVRRGEKTDVEFYNGYIIRRALELQIACPHNLMIMSMVKGKQAMKSRENNSYITLRRDL